MTVHMPNIKRPSAEVFRKKDVTFAGSFELSVTLICLLLSKRLLVTVVRMNYNVLP